MSHDPYPLLHRIEPSVNTEGGRKRLHAAVVASPSGEHLATLAITDTTRPGERYAITARLGPGSLHMLITVLQRALSDLDDRPGGPGPRHAGDGPRRPGVPRGRTSP